MKKFEDLANVKKKKSSLVRWEDFRPRHYIWQKDNSVHDPENSCTMKHGGGSILFQEYASTAGTRKPVRIESKMDGVKYSARGSPSNRTMILLPKSFQPENLNVLESPDLNMSHESVARLGKSLLTNGLHPIWQSLSDFAEKNEQRNIRLCICEADRDIIPLIPEGTRSTLLLKVFRN